MSTNIYESGNEDDVFASLLSDGPSLNEGVGSNVGNVQHGKRGVHAIKNRLHNSKLHSQWGFNAGAERSFELTKVRNSENRMEPSENSPLLESTFRDDIFTTNPYKQPHNQDSYRHNRGVHKKKYIPRNTASMGIIRNKSPIQRSSCCMWCTGCFCFQCVRTKQVGVVETFGQVSLSSTLFSLFFFQFLQ